MLVLEGGERTRDRSNKSTNLKTHVDFLCVYKITCMLKVEKSPHTCGEKINQPTTTAAVQLCP